MPNLSISTGVVDYTINDKVTLRLNPTDPAFVKRLYSRFTELETEDKAWRDKIRDEKDPVKLLEIYDEGDRMIRTALDDVLGDDVSDAVFGGVSALAMGDGFPVWMNLLLAIIDEMDAKIRAEQSTTNPRLDKYLKKYHR